MCLDVYDSYIGLTGFPIHCYASACTYLTMISLFYTLGLINCLYFSHTFFGSSLSQTKTVVASPNKLTNKAKLRIPFLKVCGTGLYVSCKKSQPQSKLSVNSYATHNKLKRFVLLVRTFKSSFLGRLLHI